MAFTTLRLNGREYLSKYFMRLSIPSVLCAFCLMCAALLAPMTKSAHAESVSTSTPAGLNAAQAKQLINVLTDEAQRTQFITTLQNLTAAQQTQQHKTLLELINTNLSDFGELALTQLDILHQNIIDFGVISPWLYQLFHDDDLQASILQTMLRVLIMLGGSFLLFYGTRFALRPLHRRMEARAQAHDQTIILQTARKIEENETAAETEANTPSAAALHATPAPQRQASSDDEDNDTDLTEDLRLAAESLRRQGALTQLMICLKRAPYTLAASALHIISILMFPLTALLIQLIDPARSPEISHAIWSIAWLVGIGLGVWSILLRAILAPQEPWLRLCILRDQTSAFLYTYLHRIGALIAWGFATLHVLKDLSLPEPVSNGLGKIFLLLVHLCIAAMIIHARGMVQKACKRISKANKHLQSIMPLVSRSWWIVALFFDFALWLVWAADIAGGYQLILKFFLRTCAALIIVRVISILFYGGLERFMRTLETWNLNPETLTRIHRYHPAATSLIRAIMFVITLLALAIAWGAPIYRVIGQNTLGARSLQAAVTIILALVIGVIAWELANITIENHIRKLGTQNDRDTKARIARLKTLTPMFRILLLLILAVIIGLTVLSQLGIDTGPLIASASIFGVALGFGSQKLVQDFISGIFLLLENALTVGDSVTLNGTYGVVERLSLRSVHVRANDGSMNIFSFSSLNQVTNYNRDFSRAMIIAVVDIGTDTDAVVAIFREIAQELRVDPAFKDLIIADFALWGVSAIGESSVTVRGVYPTITSGRWAVEWEFNRRMKKHFEEKGISYPKDVIDIQGPALDALTATNAKASPPSA